MVYRSLDPTLGFSLGERPYTAYPWGFRVSEFIIEENTLVFIEGVPGEPGDGSKRPLPFGWGAGGARVPYIGERWLSFTNV